MKRRYIMVRMAPTFCEESHEIPDAFNDGFVFDPLIGKPIVAGDIVHYVLVKYESEDEKPKVQGEFSDVVSLKEVPNSDVDTYLLQGYQVQAIYAKATVMVKRR